MSSTTYRSSDDCKIYAMRDGYKIGEAENLTFITEGNAATGTVSFKECAADPRLCDLVVEQYLHVGILKKIFHHVELSDNLYLETPIVFVTDRLETISEG